MRGLLKLLSEAAKSNYKELLLPYRMTFIVTNRCQLKCSMCGIWRKSHRGELTTAEISEFFKRSNHFLWVNLSGGEIFLREDIREIIGTIHSNCRDLYLLDFPTNGFQTERIVDEVRYILSLRVPKVAVTVSLDGPPDVHDRIRGVAGSWQRAVGTFNGLRKLRSPSLKVFFGMTLQPANLDAFIAAVEAADKAIGNVTAKDFHANMMHRSGHYYGNVAENGIDDRTAACDRISSVMKSRNISPLDPIGFLERRYQGLCGQYGRTGRTPIPCQALSASFFMDPAGNVFPCSIYGQPIGNIADFGFDICKLWEAGSRTDLRGKIRKGDCPNCWTPCEAYQSILANILPKINVSRNR